MKNKIAYILILAVAVVTAFFMGKNQTEIPNKYEYLNLDAVTKTEIDGETVRIQTINGDYYVLFGIKK